MPEIGPVVSKEEFTNLVRELCTAAREVERRAFSHYPCDSLEENYTRAKLRVLNAYDNLSDLMERTVETASELLYSHGDGE